MLLASTAMLVMRAALVRVLFALVFAIVLVAAPRSARARDAAEGTPEAARRDGDEAMTAHHFDEALASYRRAYDATKNPALLYDLARAYEGLEEFPRALDALEEFLDKAPPESRARVPAPDELARDLRNRVSSLVVTCSVAGAEIRASDRIVGKTRAGQVLVRLNAGKQRIVVTAPGYAPFEKEMILGGDSVETLDVALASATNASILRVTTPVEGARVAVNGHWIGIAPAETFVRAGLQEVLVARTGYDLERRTVTVAPGEKKELVVQLHERQSILKEWWFWTAVGVIAVGATSAVVIASEAR